MSDEEMLRQAKEARTVLREGVALLATPFDKAEMVKMTDAALGEMIDGFREAATVFQQRLGELVSERNRRLQDGSAA